MYDTEAFAIRVADRVASMMRFHRVVDVEDKLFTNLAIAGAIVGTDAFIMEIDCARDARAQVYTERSI